MHRQNSDTMPHRSAVKRGDPRSEAPAPIIALAERLPQKSVWFALAVAAIGLVVLIGWATHIAVLKSVVPGLTTMKVNTAFSLILLAIALAAANRPGTVSRVIVFTSLFTCVAVGISTVAEYLLHVDLHIDNLLFFDDVPTVFPGRMAPGTILCFMIYAVALLLLEIRRGVFLAQTAMGAVIGISFATLGGYLYGAPQMLAHAPYPVVALNTATALILLAIGALLKQPTQGPMSIMMADTTGGWLARRLIPTAMAVPLAVGLVVIIGQRAGLYGVAFAVALTVSADVTLMTAVVWSVARLLSHSDAVRQVTESEAERNSHLKDNFLATLSHELRTPMMAILGWSVILSRRDDIDDETREAVEVIERNARAQTQIIEDLLDMSRIISGKMHLDVDRVDLRKVIADAIQTVRPSAQAKQLQMEITINPDVPGVMGDANRIQQIAWNLLSNAVKFTPRGGSLRVRLAQDESQVLFVVEDTGQGIKEEFLPYIFERFRQADAGTTRSHGGLGLGLSIVRQLVELHGGTVSVESGGDGKGSIFTVFFPVAETVQSSVADEVKPQTADAPKLKPTAADSISRSIQGLRVLVVDDEADARSLIQRVLEEYHAIVVTAVSGAEAIARLDAQRFDVLVCDIGMPNQDGYELIRTIRRRDPRSGGDLPAAALTAFARSEDRTMALSSGFQLHTAKPIEPSELIATVASLAGRARLN